ncbi:MAG TPA: FxsA family protein, partial [Kribbella sp.]|nr:FxsA family protein [Kribbella sp.]
REGRRAWKALQSALETGKLPGRELTDGGLVLIGGTLLLTPGFVTDVFGFFFVLPFTRPLARRLVTRFINRRATTLTPPAFTPFIPGANQPRPPAGDVIQGEVIDPDKK